jgi:signal transduction histidine kinase
MISDNFEKMQFMPGSGLIAHEVDIDAKTDFYSDTYRVSVIMNNLISNSIKYYDANKNHSLIRIAVSIDKDMAVIQFMDNGIGIEERYLTRVFDMFFRGTETNKGAGLGLYIVKEAVEKLRGDIQIESVIGQGTVFKITLPNFVSEPQAFSDSQQMAAVY